MKILLLQLSDIHFKSKNNPIVDRIDAIRRAIQGLPGPLDACVVVVTGDIADSGGPAEYAVAHSFFDRLREDLSTLGSGLLVEEVFIPGNHDCHLQQDQVQVRKIVVDTVLRDPETWRDDSESSLVRNCLQAQNNFARFLSERAQRSSAQIQSLPEPFTGLFHSVDITAAGTSIRFLCINTAWLSQRREEPSKLIAPTWAIPDSASASSHLSVALFHHPYTWLEPGNAKDLRTLVSRISDIVMTGHEHIAEQFTTSTIRGEQNECFEGAVLQDGDASESGFNTLLIDLDLRVCKPTLHTWRTDYYAAQEDTDWRPLRVRHTKPSGSFEPTGEFAAWLADAGAAFTHPRKSVLNLADIFVYPELEDCTPFRKGEDSIVPGHAIQEYLRKHRSVMVIGGERSGRTALAKTLWQDFRRAGSIPVFLNGGELKRQDEDAIRKLIANQAAGQYGADQVERFHQLDSSERILLVDDLGHCGANLNSRGMREALDCLGRMFDVVVLFVDEFFPIEEVTQQAEGSAVGALLAFRRCMIKPLGHRLRRQLIEKWQYLGQEYTAHEEDVVHQVRDAENLVNTLLGNNLLPSFPLFVLSILQTREASSAHNTAVGALGYHYEAMITAALYRATRMRQSGIMVGTIYTYVSGIAFRMFQQKQTRLSTDEMEQATAAYKARMAMRFSNSEMVNILHEARIVSKDSSGYYSFAYPYVYYYFVARYIHDNIQTAAHEAALRGLVQQMTCRLYVEEYANIMIFLVHLAKDERTIRTILEHGRSLYAHEEPCDLDSHVAFVERLTGRPLPALQLDVSNIEKNNEEYRSRLDEATRLERATLEGNEQVRLREDEELDAVLQVNAALKTLQVMGQILRNFPGSLPGDLKNELTTECYLLGLRTLRMLYRAMEENLDGFRVFFSHVIRHVEGIEDERELAAAADQMFSKLVLASSYWMIKTISRAVGSDQLAETYREVAASQGSLPFSLIDLSLKLDHFRQFPVSEVDAVKGMTTSRRVRNSGASWSKETEVVVRKRVAYHLLRCLVSNHFYLYPVSSDVRHSICDKLGITVNDPRMLGSSRKMLAGKR